VVFTPTPTLPRQGGGGGRLSREHIHPRVTQKRLAHAQPLRLGERVGLAAAKTQALRPRRLGRQTQHGGAVAHQRLLIFADAIPFQHREFRRVQGGALAVAEDAGEGEDARLSARQQLLHRKFRRSVQIRRRARAVAGDQLCGKPVQMRFIAWG
jgi:hypothetical protein